MNELNQRIFLVKMVCIINTSVFLAAWCAVDNNVGLLVFMTWASLVSNVVLPWLMRRKEE